MCMITDRGIVPLLYQSSHPLPTTIDARKLEVLTRRIQFGRDEVVKARGSTVRNALDGIRRWPGAEFAIKVIKVTKALTDEKGLVAPNYDRSEVRRSERSWITFQLMSVLG
jgi:malate dehydrogenase